MNDRIGLAILVTSLLGFAVCCTQSARAPLYPLADTLCVVAAEAAGLDESAASKSCGIAVDVVHDIVGAHNAAKAKLAAAPSASASGSAK